MRCSGRSRGDAAAVGAGRVVAAWGERCWQGRGGVAARVEGGALRRIDTVGVGVGRRAARLRRRGRRGGQRAAAAAGRMNGNDEGGRMPCSEGGTCATLRADRDPTGRRWLRRSQAAARRLGDLESGLCCCGTPGPARAAVAARPLSLSLGWQIATGPPAADSDSESDRHRRAAQHPGHWPWRAPALAA